MAGENTVSTLDGFFKEIYADKLVDLRLKGFVFQNDFKFVNKSKAPGGTYHQAVQVQHEHGFTYSPSSGGAFTLNAAVAGGTEDATVLGTQMLLRSRMDYETAARATNSRGAFKDATRLLVEEMVAARVKRTEIELLYGQVSIGKIEAVGNNYVDIYADYWAPGIWSGMEGAKVQFWSSQAATATERVSGVGAGVGAIISAVNLSTTHATINRRISFTSAYDIDHATLGPVADDFVYFHGARTATAHNCFRGLHSICSATGGTDLFSIDPANFSLWAPTTYDVDTDLTFSKVQKAVVQAMGKGLDREICLYISPRTWSDLLDDEVALRRWNDGKKTNYKVGADGITFYSQNGAIKIKTSNYIWESFGYLIAPDLYKRIGAVDWTFNLPGAAEGGRFFENIPDAAGYELRTYAHQALFTAKPGCSILLNNITVNA